MTHLLGLEYALEGTAPLSVPTIREAVERINGEAPHNGICLYQGWGSRSVLILSYLRQENDAPLVRKCIERQIGRGTGAYHLEPLHIPVQQPVVFCMDWTATPQQRDAILNDLQSRLCRWTRRGNPLFPGLSRKGLYTNVLLPDSSLLYTEWAPGEFAAFRRSREFEALAFLVEQASPGRCAEYLLQRV